MDPKLQAAIDGLSSPYYSHADFWINVVIGAVGLIFSFLAYLEAGRAKNAALQAGVSVKIQTVNVELSEISHRLDKLEVNISYSDARDFLNEISRRLRRLISPFQNDDELREPISNLKTCLDQAKRALTDLRPEDNASIDEATIYYGIEGHLSTISSLVADLMGIFERKTLTK